MTNTDKAWVAGWDASLTFQTSNPYKRRDFANAFKRGREAGKRASPDDVRILKVRLSRIAKREG